jgi:hypothetical protein
MRKTFLTFCAIIGVVVALAFPAKSEQSASNRLLELLERLRERKPTPVLRHSFACASKDIFLNIYGRVQKLVEAGSNDAGYRLLFEQLAHGDCVILKPGTMVILEREEINSVPQIVCLRPLGDDGCYWASWSLAPDQDLSR